MGQKPRISSSTHIAAPAETVYALVSDLPRMAEWSPENTGGQWVGQPAGPTVGARFKGTNASDTKKWSTTVTITDATAPRRFAFRNAVGPKVFSEWIYEIEPAANGAGCQVTETWVDGRGPVTSILGKALTGVDDREAYTKSMIETTLAKIKAAAESFS